MAEIVFLEVNTNTNIIVGVHSEDIPPDNLPNGYSTVQKEVEDPIGLVGQDLAIADLEIDKRVTLADLTLAEIQRIELRRLSIELDLQVRMGENTAATQAEFDALKNLYQNPV